ncbi:MAG: hypothetical protein I4O51_06100 [Flavobacterium micromati]|nr:hypothetical protein [Flavobacterium micromati]
MKKSLLNFATVLLTMLSISSCSNDDNVVTPPVVVIPPVSGPVELTGTLSTRTLSSTTKYLLKGQVFVNDGQTLTIEPGTIIFGDKATKGTLIIAPGGKIIANGTATQPIVFTSALPANTRDRGDWGGLVILGRANVNQASPAIEGITPSVTYGGTNDADNSGSLKFVRVEFAGIELTPNNETNSITLGGVGSGTVLENTQVSFGGDDGFEWFGGSVNGKNLISFASWDDSFDVDFGFSGKVQFGVEVRYPSFADQSGSNSFECDNGPNDNVTTLLSTGVFSNFTLIGPKLTASQSINANYQHSLDLRRRVAVTIANSVFVGYPRGIRFNQQSVVDNYSGTANGFLLNNVMHTNSNSSSNPVYAVGSGMTATAANIATLWTATNVMSNEPDNAVGYTALGLNTNIFFGVKSNTGYEANPTFAVTSGLLASGASFTNAKLSGLTITPYVGAFGATDWTDGWAEFNPIAKAY